MSRETAVTTAAAYFDEGRFERDLARRVAIASTSQETDNRPELQRYLEGEIGPALADLGFEWSTFDNPEMANVPFLVAERIEDPALPTILTYGHGDTVRGHEGRWRDGRDPWTLTRDGDRLYGRGTADNKAQHTINQIALEAALKARNGKLGFNVKALIETGEEVGSPGLRPFCRAQADRLKADLLVASDGPRVAPDRPTLYFGSRGVINFTLTVDLRQGAHHSGNWGGALANPGTILANALASLVDGRGAIKVEALRPTSLTETVRAALADITIDGGPGAPAIDADWGEPGLTSAERVYGWNALEVLAFVTGDPAKPVNAIPGRAEAVCQLRFVVGTRPEEVVPAIAEHLRRAGFPQVVVEQAKDTPMPATRLDPDHPAARFAARSLEATTGKRPALLPNLGGTIPNDAFSEILAMPTVWVPHSYAGCSQHAPNEHVLRPVCREALTLMAGLWYDLGEPDSPLRAA